MAFTRRRFVQAAGSGLAASAFGLPFAARAQSDAIRVGLMSHRASKIELLISTDFLATTAS